jgi:hypothetical protein
MDASESDGSRPRAGMHLAEGAASIIEEKVHLVARKRSGAYLGAGRWEKLAGNLRNARSAPPLPLRGSAIFNRRRRRTAGHALHPVLVVVKQVIWGSGSTL